jgi:hypothetical protein
MQKTDAKPKARQATRPPLYWRNRWRVRGGLFKADGTRRGFILPDGTVIPADERGEALTPAIWSTKEQAEQKAMEILARHKAPAIYLGPVPCDKSGNPL